MLGEWIKAERERRGWGQSELARRVGVSSAYINQLEAGKRARIGADVAQSLAAVFGVSVDRVVNHPTLPDPLAGLQNEGVPDPMLQELLNVWNDLTPEDQEMGVAMLRTLWVQAKARQERSATNRPSQPRTAEG